MGIVDFTYRYCLYRYNSHGNTKMGNTRQISPGLSHSTPVLPRFLCGNRHLFFGLAADAEKKDCRCAFLCIATAPSYLEGWGQFGCLHVSCVMCMALNPDSLPPGGRGTAKRWKEPAGTKAKNVALLRADMESAPTKIRSAIRIDRNTESVEAADPR